MTCRAGSAFPVGLGTDSRYEGQGKSRPVATDHERPVSAVPENRLRAHTPFRAIECEHAPRVGTAEPRILHRRTARVLSYDIRPELKILLVSLRHADNPTNGKSIPEKKGCPAADAGATMPANNKDLGDIGSPITRSPRA